VRNAHFNGNRWQIVLQYVAKLAGIPRYSTDSKHQPWKILSEWNGIV